ncbi:hypothetical protein BGZ46_000441 [Entomortierella lignicola]|nr:hypothetical protein BGZ46_000441 [Entomortierella lignicola]
MGQLNINLCTTTDGTYIYALADAPQYDPSQPYNYYGGATYHILLKSVANPTSFETAGWTFLAAIPAAGSTTFGGAWPGYLCRVDTNGVVTLLVSTTSPTGGPTTTSTHARGIQWNPAGTNTITNTTGSGGWSLLDSTTTIIWDWTASGTLALFNTTPALIYVDSYTLLDFAPLDPTTSLFTWQSTTWNLQTLKAAYDVEMLDYGNNTLYMMGVSTTMFLITIPLTSVQSIPALSSLNVYNYTLATGDCSPSHYYSMMNIVGNELFILCTQTNTATIYHFDGSKWTTPIYMPSVPWSTPGAGRFVRAPTGELWAYVQDYSSYYTITISGTTASWTRVNPINITQNYGSYTGPTPTYSPYPYPTTGSGGSISSSSDGISGGAIAGIIIGVIVVLFGIGFLFYKNRKDTANNTPEAPGGAQAPPAPVKETYLSQNPAIPPQYAVYPDATQQYTGYYTQGIPVAGTTYTTAQPYPVTQQYSPAYSGGATFPSGVSQVSPHLSIAPQISPNLSTTSNTIPASVASTGASSIQANLSDIRFSVHPRPNIVQGATYNIETSTISPEYGVATTSSVPPLLPSHSRPEMPPNNPQYVPM